MMQINNYAKFINSIESFNKDGSIRVLLVIDFINKKVIVVDGSRSDFRFKEYIKNYDVKVNNGATAMFKVIELNDSFNHFNCNPKKKLQKARCFSLSTMQIMCYRKMEKTYLSMIFIQGRMKFIIV